MQRHNFTPILAILLGLLLLPVIFLLLICFAVIGVIFFLTSYAKFRSSTSYPQKIENFQGNTYDHHET